MPDQATQSDGKQRCWGEERRLGKIYLLGYKEDRGPSEIISEMEVVELQPESNVRSDERAYYWIKQLELGDEYVHTLWANRGFHRMLWLPNVKRIRCLESTKLDGSYLSDQIDEYLYKELAKQMGRLC